MTAIAKLDPRYAISLGGFDRRGAAASINHASATGFTVSGCWSDQADFAVLYLANADDLYGHLFTSRYLPDSSLAFVTLDFDLALAGCMNPTSWKYQSVPWGSLSYITSGETLGKVALPAPTATTGGAAASASFTVAGVNHTYDRIQLIYLGNIVFDVSSPGAGETGLPIVTLPPCSVYGLGYVHTVTSSSAAYSYTQVAGDTGATIATGLAAAINAGAGDPMAVASTLGSSVVLTIRPTCSVTSSWFGNEYTAEVGHVSIGSYVPVTFSFFNSFGTGYTHFIRLVNSGNSQTYDYVQQAGDGSSDIATALANLINATFSDKATATASANNVVLSTQYPLLAYPTACSASDGNGPGSAQGACAYYTCGPGPLGTGYVHSVVIGSNTYNYTELATDTADTILTALIGEINAGAGDPNVCAYIGPFWELLLAPTNAGPTEITDPYGGFAPELLGPEYPMCTAMVSAINGSGYLTAVASGASFTVSAPLGRDGNGIELLTMYKTSGSTQLYPAGSSSTASGQTAKLTGGVDPTSMHYHLDFSALGLDSCRKIWLTLAPWLTYDSGSVNPSLVAYAPMEFSALFSNWTVVDSAGVTALKVAGPGSVTIGSRDAWTNYAGTGWYEEAGFYFQGFARQSSHAGDTVTVRYSCQHTHNLYLGTAVGSTGGAFSASVDGGAAWTVNAYALESTAFAGRRSIATNVPAGVHLVTLTVASGRCVFDFLQAAVISDPAAPATTYPHLNAACDYDTDQTYKIPPARALWILGQMGFAGDIDFYAGVFFALKRIRNGGHFHQVTVTIAGTIGTGGGFGNGDAFFFLIGTTSLGAAAYPADTLATLAQRLVDAINGTFVGVRAATGSTAGQFTVTSLSPVDGFTMTVSAASGSTGTIGMTGDIGIGNEGTWAVDASQASPLNRAFTDYLADFAGLVHAAGRTMTVAFSQELLAPPDANTAGGAWAQRFADGMTVLTATGFGSWGAGVVDGVSGSGPQTIEQVGHGYITGNTVHVAQGSSGAVWAVTVTDADHYQPTTLVSGTAFTIAPGATTLIDLQTSQCTFNPATVTAYLAKCYVQAANILAAATLVPWLQFGEVGWWFYSERMSQAVGYASWTAPISIGTAAPHGFATGQTAIQAGIQGNTAANGTWPIVVTDATHYTLTGSSGNGTYVAGTGTATGGGMAYYDAWAQASALTALGRALASFWTQDDDPTINGSADAWWLAGAIKTHIDTIRAAVLAAQSGAKFELLYPQDVNGAECYYTDDLPYPQGGRLNAAVNFPTAYRAQSGSGLDRLKVEGLSWGSTYRNLTNAAAAIGFPTSAPCTWPAAVTAYLVPIFNGGCPWSAEYLIAIDTPLVNLWAVDHMVLLDWAVPMPVEASFSVVE